MMGAPLGPRQRNCSPSCQMRVYCSARRMAAGRWVRAHTNGHPAGRGAGLSPAAHRSGEASTVLVRPSPHRQQRGGDDRQQSRVPAPRRWSDLPGRRLVEGEQGSGLGLGEVTGAAPLAPQVAPCGLRRAQVVAGRGPGVEEHQTAHQAPGPAPCGCRSRRPSRRRFGSVLLCAEGAVTWHVDVVGFAGHCRSSASFVVSGTPKPSVGVSVCQPRTYDRPQLRSPVSGMTIGTPRVEDVPLRRSGRALAVDRHGRGARPPTSDGCPSPSSAADEAPPARPCPARRGWRIDIPSRADDLVGRPARGRSRVVNVRGSDRVVATL
jgi:hypothetical protein